MGARRQVVEERVVINVTCRRNRSSCRMNRTRTPAPPAPLGAVLPWAVGASPQPSPHMQQWRATRSSSITTQARHTGVAQRRGPHQPTPCPDGTPAALRPSVWTTRGRRCCRREASHPPPHSQQLLRARRHSPLVVAPSTRASSAAERRTMQRRGPRHQRHRLGCGGRLLLPVTAHTMHGPSPPGLPPRIGSSPQMPPRPALVQGACSGMSRVPPHRMHLHLRAPQPGSTVTGSMRGPPCSRSPGPPRPRAVRSSPAVPLVRPCHHRRHHSFIGSRACRASCGTGPA